MARYKVEFEVITDKEGKAEEIKYYLEKYLYPFALPYPCDPVSIDVKEE